LIGKEKVRRPREREARLVEALALSL